MFTTTLLFPAGLLLWSLEPLVGFRGLWLLWLVLLAILWAAVALVGEGFGSLVRGLLAGLTRGLLAAGLLKSRGELPPPRLTLVGVQLPPLPPAPPTLPKPPSTFLTRGLTPWMVGGKTGLVEETFGGDMVGLTENQICPDQRGCQGGHGVRGQCKKS